MNMITFSARDRAKIIELHTALADALEANNATGVDAALAGLESYTTNLAKSVMEKRKNKA